MAERTGAHVEGIDRSVLRGIAAFRWLAWVWMAVVLYLARGALARPAAAVTLVIVALVVTVWITTLLDRDPARLHTPRVVGVEVGVALALQLADGVVYRSPHVFTGEQPLGVAWPIAALMAAGVAFGPAVGGVTGVLLGAGRAVSSLSSVAPDQPDAWLGPLTAVQVLSLTTTTVLYALAGGVAGYAARSVHEAQVRVRDAERAVAQANAREEVARRLHDGVLQTLALVERSTDDPRLSRLARDQERELRDYLIGGDPRSAGPGGLAAALRVAAARFERAHDARVQVLVPDDLPVLSPARVEALVAAVGELLTNAGKHGRARTVTVSVEPTEDGVACSVRDDGAGFDVEAVPEGLGLRRSVRGRIEEVGGTVELRSAPGRGTQALLTVPAN